MLPASSRCAKASFMLIPTVLLLCSKKRNIQDRVAIIGAIMINGSLWNSGACKDLTTFIGAGEKEEDTRIAARLRAISGFKCYEKSLCHGSMMNHYGWVTSAAGSHKAHRIQGLEGARTRFKERWEPHKYTPVSFVSRIHLFPSFLHVLPSIISSLN